MSFADIRGQQTAVRILKKEIEKDRISHAYLFTGQEGIGKKCLALQFARTLMCPEVTGDSCDKCITCKKIDHGNHPDIRIIKREEDSSIIKIDQIRELQKDIAYKPYEGGRKVYIITEADKMTPQAANCLLKTLEEPPGYAVIVLLTAAVNRLLPTVISRCQRIDLRNLPAGEIRKMLLAEEGTGVQKREDAHLFAVLAAGSPGRAFELAGDGDFISRRSELYNLLTGLPEADNVELFTGADKIDSMLSDDYPVFDLLSYWYRDIMLNRYGNGDKLINYDYRGEITAQGKIYTETELINIIELIDQYENFIEHHARSDLILEVLMLKIRAKRV